MFEGVRVREKKGERPLEFRGGQESCGILEPAKIRNRNREQKRENRMEAKRHFYFMLPAALPGEGAFASALHR